MADQGRGPTEHELWDARERQAGRPSMHLYPVVTVPAAPGWDDIRHLSYHEPILHHAVMMVEQPYSNVSREQALTLAVFALYNAKAALFRAEVDRRNAEVTNARWVCPEPRQPL